MFGTYTVQLDSVVVWLMAIAMTAILAILLKKVEDRKARRLAEKRAKDGAEYAERKLHQKRAHQLNHGRHVYNWLERELKEYKDFLMLIKHEDNGGAYTIQVYDKVDHRPVLQLDYDFVKYPEPYCGHIHYGAYGADILLWIGDSSPLNGLDHQVVQEIRRFLSPRMHRANASQQV